MIFGLDWPVAIIVFIVVAGATYWLLKHLSRR